MGLCLLNALLGLFGLGAGMVGGLYTWWWFSVGRWRVRARELIGHGFQVGRIIDVFLPGFGWVSASKRRFQDEGEDVMPWGNSRVVDIVRGLIGWRVGWDPAMLLNPHMLVAGASGWGKTSLLRRLVKFTWLTRFRGYRIMVFDYLGSFTDLGLPVVDLSVTPVKPLGLVASREAGFSSGGPGRRARVFAEAFSVATGLGPLQLGLVMQATRQAFKAKGIVDSDKGTWTRESPDIEDIAAGLRRVVGRRRFEEVGKLEARLNELMLIYESAESTIGLKKIYRVIREEGGIILDMHGLDLHARIFFTDLIVRRLLDYAQSTRTRLNLMMVVDEAKYAGFLERRSSEVRPGVEAALVARNYGVGVVLSSQGLAHFPGDVLRNIAFKIIGSLTHPLDKEFVSRSMGDKVGLVIDVLSRGRCVVELMFASGGMGKDLVPRLVFLVGAS